MSTKSILLVDDSDLVASMIGEALKEAGFEVIRAKDGYEAIELCYKIIPNIIIMDIDMPLLKGYQASRLLKTRRGVKNIPIIMHTAASEDKDKFWSYNSGASAFVIKNYENIEPLVEAVKKHIIPENPDIKAIQEDARSLSRDSIAEALSNMLDKELFRSTIMNQLADAGRQMSSLSSTIERVLELLDLACERQVACIILKFGKEALAYAYPSASANREMCEDFMAVAIEDFFSHHDRNTLKLASTHYFNIDERPEWNKIRINREQLSSYYYIPIIGSGDKAIGTLHLANTRNNYFSESVTDSIAAFANEAGVIIHNAMLFRQLSIMEREIRNVFSKFVPQEIIDDLVARKSSASMLAGEKRELAIVFSDIRSFTSLTEINPPEVVVSFLNMYLETMCEHIIAHGGLVDKFIGDAILAVFGAPKSWPDNALRAIETALAMSHALKDLDTSNIKLPSEGLNIGIGLHFGDAIVGTIGSSTKFDYTVIGDSVNLASRLENLSKRYRVRIIVSESIVQEINRLKIEHPHFRFREIEEVVVKGKEEPTRIYMLEDETSGWIEHSACDLYRKGISMYRLHNWKTAAEYFSAILDSGHDDTLSLMYLERCKEYQLNPPPKDWDLVQHLDTK